MWMVWLSLLLAHHIGQSQYRTRHNHSQTSNENSTILIDNNYSWKPNKNIAHVNGCMKKMSAALDFAAHKKKIRWIALQPNINNCQSIRKYIFIITGLNRLLTQNNQLFAVYRFISSEHISTPKSHLARPSTRSFFFSSCLFLYSGQNIFQNAWVNSQI